MSSRPEIDWPSAKVTPKTLALEVPVLRSTREWRAAFMRLASERNLRVQPGEWSDIVIVANRIVVKGVVPGAEERLRSELDAVSELAVSAARTQDKLAGLIRRR